MFEFAINQFVLAMDIKEPPILVFKDRNELECGTI